MPHLSNFVSLTSNYLKNLKEALHRPKVNGLSVFERQRRGLPVLDPYLLRPVGVLEDQIGSTEFSARLGFGFDRPVHGRFARLALGMQCGEFGLHRNTGILCSGSYVTRRSFNFYESC